MQFACITLHVSDASYVGTVYFLIPSCLHTAGTAVLYLAALSRKPKLLTIPGAFSKYTAYFYLSAAHVSWIVAMFLGDVHVA